MKTWKEDENTFKSNRLNEGLGLTTTILSKLEERLSSLAEDNGWSCERSENSYEEGVKYTLMPIDPRDSESFTSYKEMMRFVKEEFSEFGEEQLTVSYSPYLRYGIPIITVIFN